MSKKNKYTRKLIPYINGKKHGIIKEYFRNTKQLSQLMIYENGLRQGMHVGYYANGHKRYNRTYINDKLDGKENTWYKVVRNILILSSIMVNL